MTGQPTCLSEEVEGCMVADMYIEGACHVAGGTGDA